MLAANQIMIANGCGIISIPIEHQPEQEICFLQTHYNAMNLWTQYGEADKEMMALFKQGRTEDARAVLEGECVDLYNALNSAFGGDSYHCHNPDRSFLLVCNRPHDKNSYFRNPECGYQNGSGGSGCRHFLYL